MSDIIILLLIIGAPFGMFAAMISSCYETSFQSMKGTHSYDGDMALVKVCGAIFVICFAVAIGLAIFSATGKTYKMHDVTVRLYYLDGSQDVKHFNVLHYYEPRLYCRSRPPLPFFRAGRVVIPCVSRFEIIDERKYEMTGRELRSYELQKGGAK